MPRKSTSFATIKVSDMNVAEIKQCIIDDDTPVHKKIAAAYLLDDIIAQLKMFKDQVIEEISSSSLSDIQKNFIDNGLCGEGEVPVIVVGDKIKIKLSEKLENNFAADTKKLSELGELVPEKYKKISVAFDKKVLEADYESGVLDPLLKPFVSMSPATVVKMTRTTIKEDE